MVWINRIEAVTSDDVGIGASRWALWRQSGHKGRPWLTAKVIVPPISPNYKVCIFLYIILLTIAKLNVSYIKSNNNNNNHNHNNVEFIIVCMEASEPKWVNILNIIRVKLLRL